MSTSDIITIVLFSLTALGSLIAGGAAIIKGLGEKNEKLEKEKLATQLKGLSDQNTDIMKHIKNQDVILKDIQAQWEENDKKDAVIQEKVKQNTKDIDELKSSVKQLQKSKLH